MDATGLVYMRARYYDPAIGRFISKDSAKDGGNWYAYAGGNPVGMVDADGTTPEDEMAYTYGEFLKIMARAYSTAGTGYLAVGLAELDRGKALGMIGMAIDSPAAVAAGYFLEAAGGVTTKNGVKLKLAAILMNMAANYAQSLGQDFWSLSNDLSDSIIGLL